MKYKQLLNNSKLMDRLITIAVIILAGNLFLFLKLYGSNSTDDILTQNNGYVFLIPTISGLLLSLSMLFMEDHVFKKIEQRVPFYQQLIIRWLIGSTFIATVTGSIYIIFSLQDKTLLNSFKDSLAFLGSSTFISLYIFLLICAFFLHFIKQLGNWFGYGILLNYFLGKYNMPLEEERIFMFIDLKNSTGIAEKLGHQKYSRFLNKCFTDLSALIDKYNAEVYQYVGDEVVITWSTKDVVTAVSCIQLFFDYQMHLLQHADDYNKKFDITPTFKCSLHSGLVTLTQVGGRHKGIAYHGDVLNTAARMLELSNRYGQPFIISETIANWEGIQLHYQVRFLEPVVLRGKEKSIGVYSIHKNLSST